MKETKKICDFMTGLHYEDIPEEVVSDVRYRILDWTGCIACAFKSDSAEKIFSLAPPKTREGSSPIFSLGFGYPPDIAGFINGAIGHIAEFDDVSKSAIGHPGSVVIPTALIAAIKWKKTIGEMVTAIVCGYEAFIRLGRAVCPSHYKQWHSTGTIGTFAAAVTASKLAGFSSRQMQNALGLAATTASGLITSFGTEAKVVTVGNAVENGIRAVLLTERGLNAPENVLEQENGFFYATSTDYSSHTVLEQLGDPLLITTAGYKLHASCGHTHTVLDALLALIKEHNLSAKDIVSLEADVYSVAYRLTSAFKNETELEAKFSLPYCMAAAVIYGEVSLQQFNELARNNLELTAFAQQIHIKAKKSYDVGYPQLRTCQVTAKTADNVYVKKLDLPIQIPSDSFLKQKFISLGREFTSEAWISSVMHSILEASPEESANRIIQPIMEVY